jgi:hypothetical protein
MIIEKHEEKITDKLGKMLKRERNAAELTRGAVAERVGI